MRNKREFAERVVTDAMEALQREIYGRGALEACADATGVSHQTLSKQLNETDGNTLSLRRAMALEQFLDTDALADCFAARRGGVFIKLPDVPESADAGIAGLAVIFSRMAQAFGESSAAFSDSVRDGRIDMAEVELLAKDLRAQYTAGEQLIAAATALAKQAKT